MRRALVIAPAALLVVLGACRRSTAEPETFSDVSAVQVFGRSGQEITLAPGSRAEVTDVNLRIAFESLADSRCPTRALIACVWAGSVKVDLWVGPINGFQWLQKITLETVPGRDSAVVGGHLITLVRVTPEKEFIEPIPVEQYRVVIRVGAKQ